MSLAMITTAILESVEQTINPLLKTDAVTCKRLEALAGNVIQFEVTDLPLSLFILPIQGGVQLQQQFPSSPDVLLRGDSVTFMKLLNSNDKSEHFFGHGISVEGNSGLASQFQTILAELEIDWEALLANITGNLPAHQLVSLTRGQINYAKQVTTSVTQNINEYIQEEIRILPPRVEAECFLADVDALRERTDRLSARINAIKSKLDEPTH
ncbi:SCP2 sterol-binding domain-containing protein [Neptunomonas phycophila]|uniref:Ubiquinone biosynthesis accessory factor UbiJ n=1 Tax=Neptunomonas phycophila TaxID=1572645 RepID=A0AAW7XIW4_9GAMM|nr:MULTISPECIES: SCP2 sterol-binding domain-containing protein [Neptunomonas]MDN2660735.1 SCP2 sterol-binding domain-containing protein [Neptunomonas sp. CHC150]MDO6453676.1 SCP2 sterol-binding domain-containing protein [Neptunomonas phycophila]MDO6468014.1 SCP2 sterol-binding domain-containing protein [Neptunomonas phycophila]